MEKKHKSTPKSRRKGQKSEAIQKKRGRKPGAPRSYDGPNLTLKDSSVKEISLKKLNLDDETFQIRFSSIPDATLLDSVRTNGIQVPLIVRPLEEKKGEYQIICGFRRANAARLSEQEKVPAIIRGVDDGEAHIIAYVENEYRKTLRDIDRALAMAKFRKSGKSTGQIADLFRMSARQVQRIEGLLDYPDELKEAMDSEGGIPTTQAIILWQAKRKHGDDFILAEWIKIALESNSTEKLKKAIQGRFPSTRKRGQFLHWTAGDDRITFSLSELRNAEPERRESAVNELRELLKQIEQELSLVPA